jgi:hypothetical protein
MTKTVKQLQTLLGLQEASELSIEFGLLKLLQALRDMLERLGGVKVDGPLAIADDEFMYGLAAMNLSLAGA